MQWRPTIAMRGGRGRGDQCGSGKPIGCLSSFECCAIAVSHRVVVIPAKAGIQGLEL